MRVRRVALAVPTDGLLDPGVVEWLAARRLDAVPQIRLCHAQARPQVWVRRCAQIRTEELDVIIPPGVMVCFETRVAEVLGCTIFDGCRRGVCGLLVLVL